MRINVVNQKGEREFKELFAVEVSDRTDDRCNTHLNYVDADGNTYTNRRTSGYDSKESMLIVDDRFKGLYCTTNTSGYRNKKRTISVAVNTMLVKDESKRKELALWLKGYNKINNIRGAIISATDCNMYTANTIGKHTIDAGLECMTLEINGRKFKVNEELRNIWKNDGVNKLYSYLGV